MDKLKQLTKTIYLATEESVADDIVVILKNAMAEIAELKATALQMTKNEVKAQTTIASNIAVIAELKAENKHLIGLIEEQVETTLEKSDG